ncbi:MULTISPECIES: alpha/beta hydrolase fold domain-containing protein [Ramlibacter]|uniref:Alpha/beta hydrolase fold domain-containing protein n=1 Tax=Ramlibacter aquaticus TaxID=2780094 RepID=A0ABR9SL08_9BURK|nr:MULTISPECIES: alpha/beta hydrolase fold domain-containing protein [Ramlibacter]MBE7942467.1 alpha/beta hydrolase fold domain-containing protein [Ramlibacter aquaticus]
MASWQARIASGLVRVRVRRALGDLSDVARIRRAFSRPLPAPRGARFTPGEVGGVPGEWVEAVSGSARGTLLYLHGGGFVACSPRSHRSVTASLALRGFRVFVPDYRLAPEHPFPAGLDDCLAAWRGLVALQPEGLAPPAVAGDSAGGNLALALMLALRDAGEPLPAAAGLFSPCTDMTGGSPSILDNAKRDAMFPGEGLQHFASAYLGDGDRAHPLVSPLLADLTGLPPLLVHVGESEALRDDSVRFARKAADAGVEVSLRVWPVVPHVWQLLWALPEARASLDVAASFMLAAQARWRAARPAPAGAPPEELDVLIVGAGLSGIGAAVHLQQAFPRRRYALLEARQAIGGTWDLFRYPGVRSDSDMYTLGYVFKPWRDAKAIADGPAIRAYVRETAAEHGVLPHIRYAQRVVAAHWSSPLARWDVEVAHGDGSRSRLACRFLWMCSGYYSYAQGYKPAFPGESAFGGTLVHPQFWPQGLDHAGKRVVVIGSGATAVTLVPEMAKTAAHVVMLQRSPTYVVTRPAEDPVAEWLKRHLPAMLAYRLVRLKNVGLGMFFFRLARRWPEAMQRRLIGFARMQLPPEFDPRHFTPRYKPWDQRICLVPDGDLFRAIRSGSAEVVTDEIDTFTPQGIRLKSGRELAADIVVSATGLQLNVLGDLQISVDGAPVDLSQCLVYKGMMYSGVPNLVSTFGYTNASWTLKADLTANYACRLLRHLDRQGQAYAVPRAAPGVAQQPFLDFSSGYVVRALDRLPKQGDRKPWRLYQNYLLDLLTLRYSRLDDGVLQFGGPAPKG